MQPVRANAEIDVTPFTDAAQFDFAAGAGLSSPRNAANSRPDLKDWALPMTATAVVAVNRPNARDLGDTATCFVTAAPRRNA